MFNTLQALADGEQAGMRYALGLPRRAPLNVTGGALGQRPGGSLEFNDYREYQPGDDLRHIDWNAYARSDQLMIKLFQEEVTPHLDVVLDGSRSMALVETRKAEAAVSLAAFFAAAASNTGYSHRAWLASDVIRPLGQGAARPVRWEGIDFTFSGNPGEVLARQAHVWRPRGTRVLISDLLWLGEPLAPLEHLTNRAANVLVVQLLAEADVDPTHLGNLRLVDSETDDIQEIFVDAVALQRYSAALNRHQQHWHRACRQTGALFTTVVAEQFLRDWRLDELVAAEVLTCV
jgi:uncharacterized protein (DUF58 family)